MARTAAARLAVWTVLSAACAGGGDPGADRSDAAPPAAPFRSALIGEPSPPSPHFVLNLASPGNEPRRQVRYRVAPGTRERTRIAITNELEVFIAGRRVQRVAPPTMEMGFEVQVASRPGGYRCAAWITDTASADWERMAPGAGAELRQALEKLRGHDVSFEVDERGHPLSHEVTLPESLDAYRSEALQILQALDGSVVPLPAEPIGVGAVWTTSDAETGRSNLPGTLVFTYTLVAVRGDQIELSVQLGMPQEPGPLKLSGGELSLYSGAHTSGTGRLVVDLSRLMSDSDGTYEMDIEGRTFHQGEELPFRVHQKVHHQLDSR